MQGEITVNGQTYNGVMPAFAGNASDRDIAAVLTWLRTSEEMGNAADPVTEEAVAALRADYAGRTAAWDGSELQNQ